MSKKALLFTLTAFFLATAVLSLALLIFNYTYKSSMERTTELASLDRLSDISYSVEKSLIELSNLSFRDSAIVKENPDGTTNVTITEYLSRTQEGWSDKLEKEMVNFKTFVEKRESHVSLNIGAIQNRELPMTILPHNITYLRNWEGGHVILSVVPQQMNFGSYSVIINAGNVNISGVLSQLRKSGSFYFGVRARDNYGFNKLEEKFVDPSDSHQIQVFFTGDNKLKITLQNNNLEIWTNTNEPIEITTTIDNLEKKDDEVSTFYPESALNIVFPEFDLSKIKPLILK